MSSHTNPECAVCKEAFNGLNGRYCNRLKKYVEYAAQPLCKPKKNE